MSKFKIALAQMTSVDDLGENLKQIRNLLLQVEGQGVKVVFFPENCLYLRLLEGSRIPAFQLHDVCFAELQDWVNQNNCAIHLGSVPIEQGSKLLNASVWLEPQKAPRVSYIKMHLFDIELAGQKPIRESDVFTRGSSPEILEYCGWKFGQSICYDIRFSSLYHEYALRQVDVLLVPSAFLVPTGEAHWDILTRARAIECQCYVIASAQAGIHERQSIRRQTYGHSVVVEPWGKKAVEMASGVGVMVIELDREKIESVRRQIPMASHRCKISSSSDS